MRLRCLRAFAATSALLLVLTGFQVLAGTSTAGSPVDEQPFQFPPFQKPSSSPKGPQPGEWNAIGEGPIPQLETEVIFRPPLNVTSAYVTGTVAPVLLREAASLDYVTSFGTYSFQLSRPYLMSLKDLEGRAMADSAFVVEGDIWTQPSGGSVVEATDTTFRASYDLTDGRVTKGSMELLVSFTAARLPKITAFFVPGPNSTLGEWRVVWKIVSPARYLRTMDGAVFYLGDLQSRVAMWGGPSSPVSALLGDGPEVHLWNSMLVANWSDAGTAALYAGRVAIDDSHRGTGLAILFPPGEPLIDPSLVAQSSGSLSTRHTTQKKVFYHDGKYFAFYGDVTASPPSIRYRVGQETGSGMVWTSPLVFFSHSELTFDWGFDVDYRAGVALIAFVRTSGGTWQPSWARCTIGISVLECDTAWTPQTAYGQLGTPTSAIADDGTLWVAYPAEHASTDADRIWVYHSNIPDPSSADWTNDWFDVVNPFYTLRLVPLQGGDVTLFAAHRDSSEMTWHTWSSSSRLWSPAYNLDLNLPVGLSKADRFTASFGGASNTAPPLWIHMVYIPAGNQLMHIHLLPYSEIPLGPYEIDSAPASYPAGQHDANGDFHVFWRKGGTISYTRFDSDFWVTPVVAPFAGVVEPSYLSTGYRASVQRTFLVYTQPFGGAGAEVYFGSLPTRRGAAGMGGAPWNDPATGTGGPQSAQLNSFVSPTTGLLVLKDTDLSFPGRGLDLALERIYRTPDAFDPSTGEPWAYDQPRAYSFGNGWTLNVPWIEHDNLYLWDGQKFLTVRWDDERVFENRFGEYFRIERSGFGDNTWDLYTKSGIHYVIDLNRGGAISATDTNDNVILFNYNLYSFGWRLDSITDTMGEDLIFSYLPTTGCQQGAIPTKVCEVHYRGKTIEYHYLGERLTTVVDPIGRTTEYRYCDTPCGSIVNPWLVSASKIVTGALLTHQYTSAKVGTDTVAYLVEWQWLRDNSQSDPLISARAFTYTVVDGVILYSKMVEYDGGYSQKRSVRYSMDPRDGTLTTTIRDFTVSEVGHQEVAKRRDWYSTNARISQSDIFAAYAIESQQVTFSTASHHDWYGNLIHFRDSLGAESFSSYVNSNHRSEFYGPGRLHRTSPGGQAFTDHFSDWNGVDYLLWQSSGDVSDDMAAFESVPPSKRLATWGQGPSGVATGTFSFPTLSAPITVNVLVRANEADRWHYVGLRENGEDRAMVALAGPPFGGHIAYRDGATWVDAGGGFPYSPTPWYLLSIVVRDSSTYDLYVDGKKVGAGAFSLSNTGPVNEIYFSPGDQSNAATMWVNEFSVFRGPSFTITGLPVGSRVRVLDAASGRPVVPDVLPSGGTAAIQLTPDKYPRLIVQVLDATWGPIYTSPFREFWGGEVFEFTPPYQQTALQKTSSGFLTNLATPLWVDEQYGIPPFGSPLDGDHELWDWGNCPMPLSGTSCHTSPSQPGLHGHGFHDVATNAPHPGSSDYLVQYVYLTQEARPSEILQEFQSGIDGGWDHRAYWGLNLDGRSAPGQEGGPAHRLMGPIPTTVDRWVMLTVSEPHLAPGSDWWKGTRYYLVGGEAKWDVTAVGSSSVGQIRLTGVPSGYHVELRGDVGIVSTGYASASQEVILSVYSDESGAGWSSFPKTGWFTICTSTCPSGRVYDSPAVELFGGDSLVFSLSNAKFFPNGGINPNVKDRLAGTYRLPAGGTPQESYFQYDLKWNLIGTKVLGPQGWIESSRAPDQYGNVVSVTTLYDDTNTHTTIYDYDAAYAHAHLTEITDLVGVVTLRTTIDYYEATGELRSVTPPELQNTGLKTTYWYDDVGRLTRIDHPDGNSRTYSYYDSENLVVLKDENYDESAGKRHQTWMCYDVLGHLVKMLRIDEAGPPGGLPSCDLAASYSIESFVFNWQGLMVSRTSSEGRTYSWDYDGLGRIRHATNPDLTYVEFAYDDSPGADGMTKKTVTITSDVQSPRKTEHMYDLGGRLTKVQEYWGTGGGDYYQTTYAYDDVGNLISVLTPPDAQGNQQETIHEYDVLNRLEKTTFPDGTFEEYVYYNPGLLKQKRDRAGYWTTHTYDELKRKDMIARVDGFSDYDYDSKGRLARLSFTQNGQPNPVTLDYTYDDTRGWMKTESFTIDLVPGGTVTYDYDGMGNTVRTQGPGGYDVGYAYDGMNRACVVASGPVDDCSHAPFWARLSYYHDDMPDTFTYANGVSTKYTYDTNGRPESVRTFRDQTDLLKLDYLDYDSLGNPLWIQATGEGLSTTDETYAYDALDRVTSSSAAGGYSWTLSYGYDALGNRKFVTDPSGTTYYRYDSYSRLCATRLNAQPSSCTTDSSAEKFVYAFPWGLKGYVTSRVGPGADTWEYSYGGEGNLVTARKVGVFSLHYQYDGLGRRVKSSNPMSYYIFSGLSPIYETNPESKHIYLNGLRVAKVGQSGTEYYHYDHLGSVRVISDDAGVRIATLGYGPFGSCVYGCASEPKYGYTGEYREAASNLVYLYSRWYDPGIGRFMTPDTRLGSLMSPQDQNRYAYVWNNPVRYVDPTGHAGQGWWEGHEPASYRDRFWIFAAILTVVAIILVVAAIVAIAVAVAAYATGALSAGAYSAFALSMTAHALAGGLAGAAFGAGAALVTGGDVLQGAALGFVYGFGASAGSFGLRFLSAYQGGIRSLVSTTTLRALNAREAWRAEFGGDISQKVATGDEVFMRYFDNKVSFPRGKWATSEPPVSSSSWARFKYRLSPSGNKASLAEYVRLEPGTVYYEGRVAWRWSTQIYIEDSHAMVPMSYWPMG